MKKSQNIMKVVVATICSVEMYDSCFDFCVEETNICVVASSAIDRIFVNDL